MGASPKRAVAVQCFLPPGQLERPVLDVEVRDDLSDMRTLSEGTESDDSSVLAQHRTRNPYEALSQQSDGDDSDETSDVFEDSRTGVTETSQPEQATPVRQQIVSPSLLRRFADWSFGRSPPPSYDHDDDEEII